MDEDSFEYHKNKKTGKTYVSRSRVSKDRPGEHGVQDEPGREE